MFSSKRNTDVTKCAYGLVTMHHCDSTISQHDDDLSHEEDVQCSRGGSEDQDVWNHLFKEGVCEEVYRSLGSVPPGWGTWSLVGL